MAVVGLVVGVWALLPKYTGPATDLAPDSVEFADHVVPGVVVLVASALTLVARLRGTAYLMAGMAVALAGFWMSATHWPLVVDALGDRVPGDAAAYHSLPGLAVLVTGLVWAFFTTDGVAGAGGEVSPAADRPAPGPPTRG